MHDESALPSDESLAKAYLDGEEGALEALIERYGKRLVRFAYRFTYVLEEAEDIAQETFLRLYHHLPKLDLSQPLRPWLYHVCANLCKNHARKKKLLLFSELERITDDGEVDTSFTDNLEDTATTPDADARSSSDAEHVRSAFEELAPKYKTCLALFYFEHCSYEEIAKSLKLPINTVRTHIRRGKMELEKLLDQ